MTEEDTFRVLQRPSFSDIFARFMTSEVPIDERRQFLEDRGWDFNEFLAEYKKFILDRHSVNLV